MTETAKTIAFVAVGVVAVGGRLFHRPADAGRERRQAGRHRR